MEQSGTDGNCSVDWKVGLDPPVSSTPGEAGLGGTGGSGALHAIASSEQIL